MFRELDLGILDLDTQTNWWASYKVDYVENGENLLPAIQN